MLEARRVPLQVRHYLDDPLTMDELRLLRKKLGLPPAAWLRWKEDEAKGLDRDAPEQELIRAMAAHPRLMERPILIHGDGATVGRPDPGQAFAAVISSAGIDTR